MVLRSVLSLAGRTARLGDGTSRNPKDREALLEQRSEDLAGLIGQVRGFNLDEFSQVKLFHMQLEIEVGSRKRLRSLRRCVPRPVPAARASFTTAWPLKEFPQD